ncbi:hypothetical protein FB567DRAFT_580541 [Paraphoma chrysanthemicola]|uniref:BTB domain-containing protein n=1 Tax=Paraphoma chrysanthemicola TaxID=798071 RepID=A0A8K0R460_9PLEO|nr:hypothetical protein FB567DRAFT_580541 [Paraphoma chrysanthemicola]
MSSLYVPCRAPYRPITIHSDDETVILKVGPEDDIQEFVVPTVALCRNSPYFEDELLDRDDDLIRESLAVPRESPSYFQVALNFLQYGRLQHPHLRANTKERHLLRFPRRTLWFRVTLRPPLLALRHPRRLLPAHPGQEAHPVRLDSRCVRQHQHRQFVTRLTHRRNAEHWCAQRYRTLQEAPAVRLLGRVFDAGGEGWDCAARQGGKKGKGKGVDKWLEGKRVRICVQYHGHSRKELEEEERRLEEDEAMDDVESGGDEGWDGEEVQIEREEVDEDGYTERTKRELAFIDELKKSKTRY